MKKNVCCLCGKKFEGYGHNPEPLMPSSEGRCCDKCNKLVMKRRIKDFEQGTIR